LFDRRDENTYENGNLITGKPVLGIQGLTGLLPCFLSNFNNRQQLSLNEKTLQNISTCFYTG